MEFVGELYPFQHKVVDWAIQRESGILGLDMGLGKTVIMLSIICHHDFKKTVIVVPLSILKQWKDATTQFTTLKSSDICVYQGRTRKNKNLKYYKLILTTYETVRIDMKNPMSGLYQVQTNVDCIVLDEAHTIRNEKTQTNISCNQLGRNTNNKWLLTGTTIHNKFKDFSSLCNFLGRSTIEDEITNKDKFYYHLLKSECDIVLPPRTVTTHNLDFDPYHNSVNEILVNKMKGICEQYQNDNSRENFNCLLTQILRLRQCANHPYAHISTTEYNKHIDQYDSSKSSAKFDEILKIITESQIDDKIIIFSQWTHSLHILSRFLQFHNISSYQYDGTLSVEGKDNVLEQFKTGTTKVLLASLTSGSVGLNMTYANHVIILDSWWNKALEEQAINRIYRIGQKKSVYVHRLYMNNTIENWIISMKDEKYKVDCKFHNNNQIYFINGAVLSTILHSFL